MDDQIYTVEESNQLYEEGQLPGAKDAPSAQADVRTREATVRVGSGTIVLLRESSACAFVRALHLLACEQRNNAATYLKMGDRAPAHRLTSVAEAYDWANEEFRRLLACSERRQPQENADDEPEPRRKSAPLRPTA